MIRNTLYTILNTPLHRTFFFILVALLPTQLGYHFWPSWATVLGRRVDYLSPTLYVTDILIFLVLLTWLFGSINRFSYRVLSIKEKSLIPNTATLIPLLLFIVINIEFAVRRPVALYTWIKLFEFVALGAYIVKTKPDINRTIFFLSVSVFWSSALAVGQFVMQHSLGGPLWLLGERTFSGGTPGIAQIPLCLPGNTDCPLVLRAYGTFPHPNVLGGYIAALMPLIIYESTNLRIMKWNARQIQNNMGSLKSFYRSTIVLGIIGLMVTFGRSAWVAGTIAIVLTIARIQNRELRILNNIYTKIFTVGLVLFIFLYSVFSILTSSQESVIVRQQLNNSAIAMWQHSPILGVGLGNFIPVLPEFLPSKFIYYLQPVHNIYLLLLSEVGIAGVIVLFWIIWMVLRYVICDMRYETRRTNTNVRIAYFVSLLTILLLGLVDHYPLTLQQGRLFLTVLLGMTVAINNKQ